MDHPVILEELEDHIEQIFAATEQLREVVDDGKTERQLLEAIFRNTHSLKASAASNSLEDLTRIAHQFENLLHAVRVGQATVSADVLRAFDDTADALFASLRQPSSANRGSYEDLFKRLRLLSKTTARGNRLEVDVILSAIPFEIWEALSEEEKHRLRQSVGEGASLFLLSTSFDLANFDQRFQDLKEKLGQKGELISTAPKVDSERADKIDFRVLYTREDDLARVEQDISGLDDVTVTEIASRAPAISNERQEGRRVEYRSPSEKPHLIRIDLEDLDRLISSTHRLYRQTIACLDQLPQNRSDATAANAKVEEVSASFSKLAAELVDLRMVSIDRILQRALRAGRSTAAAARKEVDFTLLGNHLKIDKSLSDAIADPLIHLVRNAVDHGIESQEQRMAAGKNKSGNICIEATTSHGQMRIRVADDGGGIDPERVFSAGRRLGVLPDNVRPDINRSVRLLFRSGFSTATKVSETSGRGVGLDVVETAVEEIGGAIRVASNPGVGSVFEIRLPVTFSLLDVVVVKAGKHRYLIDAAEVVSIETSNREEDAKAGKENLKVLRLDDVLGLESAPDSDTKPLLLCKLQKQNSEQTQQLELQVNEIVETEQVLVRNLGARSGRWFGIAGAAEMRDGTVALLLDLAALTAVS